MSEKLGFQLPGQPLTIQFTFCTPDTLGGVPAQLTPAWTRCSVSDTAACGFLDR